MTNYIVKEFRCSKCKVVKPESDFYKTTHNRRGLIYHCKKCSYLYSVAWGKKNNERKKEIRRADYHRHKEQRQKVTKVWQTNNKERLMERQRQRVKENPDKRKEWSRRDYERRKHAYIAQSNKRKAIKKGAMPKWADTKKITAVYKHSQALSNETGITHHVDHIVPIQSHLVCGLHTHDNLQVMIESENIRKKNLHWPDMP